MTPLAALEGAWYANVGRKTGERACEAMRKASEEIRHLRMNLTAVVNLLDTHEKQVKALSDAFPLPPTT